jgi:hypothetical protein
MTAGMRTRCRKRNKGKAEKLVPPVWEATKVVEKLQYRVCSEHEALGTEAGAPGRAPHYRAAEEEGPVAWSSEVAIPELEFGHATLEEVQFEWGRSNRAFRWAAACCSVVTLQMGQLQFEKCRRLRFNQITINFWVVRQGDIF